MTIRSHLMFVVTQPLLLRLAMVAIAAVAFAAVYAIAERLLASRRTEDSTSAVQEVPRRVITTAYFW